MNHPDEILFRPARHDDLAAIVALLADDALGATREDVGESVAACYEDAFARIDGDPAHTLVVAERNGRIVGCLQLTVIPNLSHRGTSRALIEGVRVSRDFQGEGVGRRMFEWVIAQARDESCGMVQLTTDKKRPDALKFYEQLGFVASHEGMKLSLGR